MSDDSRPGGDASGASNATRRTPSAADAIEPSSRAPVDDPRSAGLRTVLRTSLLTGAVVTVPLLVTVVVVALIASVVSDAIGPFVVALSWLPVGVQNQLVLEVATVVILVGLMTAVGYVAAYRTERSRLEEPIDAIVGAIPGVGTVYETFDRMSELLADSDSQSFQEVVLVEYPTDGSYALAFRTASAPSAVEEATGHDDMTTLFMPMGPNPVAGGFVIHVSTERVHAVDLTVEQGIQSVVTSGVATGQTDAGAATPASPGAEASHAE